MKFMSRSSIVALLIIIVFIGIFIVILNGKSILSGTNITLFNAAPIAEAGQDKSTLVKKSIYFNGNNSRDPDGSIIKYSWNFGDGQNDEGVAVTHSYLNPGVYTVTLTVTDDKGATSTDSCKVDVKYIRLTANLLYPSIEWRRNPDTGLPEGHAVFRFEIWNSGSGSDIVEARILIDGVAMYQDTFIIPAAVGAGSKYSGQFETVLDYDSQQLLLVAEAWESLSSDSLNLGLPRYMPISYAMLFITPNDPIVKLKEDQITSNWLIPDLIELREWVASNIKYKYDIEVHGANDYWQLPRETIILGTGDCEDFAILLVSLLRANGYGSKDVYVLAGPSTSGGYSHAWIVVKTDLGIWWTIEPQSSTGEGIFWAILSGQLTEVSGYKAKYKFNDIEFYQIP